MTPSEGTLLGFNEAAGFIQRKLALYSRVKAPKLSRGFNEAAGFTQRKQLEDAMARVLRYNALQ